MVSHPAQWVDDMAAAGVDRWDFLFNTAVHARTEPNRTEPPRFSLLEGCAVYCVDLGTASEKWLHILEVNCNTSRANGFRPLGLRFTWR